MSSLSIRMKSWHSFPILICMLISAILIQLSFLNRRYKVRVVNPECPWCEEKAGKDVVFIPVNSTLMKLFAPADSQFLADLLWMRTAYYFGQHSLTDKQYPYLLHLLDLITDLAPQWLNPFLYGAVILPLEADEADNAMYLIEKGLIYHPDSWELWFNKGYILWRSHEDKLAAADALHKASILPGAPVFLAKLSATFATEAGNRELAFRFLYESLKQTQDPMLRSMLEKKIKEIANGG